MVHKFGVKYMNKFEVPYNFASDFIPMIKANPILIPHIKFFYLPCFSNEESFCTRQALYLFGSIPNTWDKYIQHIIELQKIAPVALLMQNGGTMEVVQKYYNNGVRIFILTDDKLAAEIKNHYQDVSTILSLTRILKQDDFYNLDLSMYDEIVLWFNYCRQLQLVKELPTKYNYSMLVNAVCYYKCAKCKEHWAINGNTFEEAEAKTTDLLSSYCHRPGGFHPDERICIEPADLTLFDPYVKTFKLVDRIDLSKDIIGALRNYTENYGVGESKGVDWYCLS